MSTRWSPSWKLIKIDIESKEIDICYDSTSKLYVCPLCSPECKKGELPTYSSYFFNVEDLKRHLDAHKNELWRKKGNRVREPLEETEDEEPDDE